MAVVNGPFKYSLKYTVSVSNNDYLSRTNSGLNIGGGNDSTGPELSLAVNALLNSISKFTTGSITVASWVSDRGITL